MFSLDEHHLDSLASQKEYKGFGMFNQHEDVQVYSADNRAPLLFLQKDPRRRKSIESTAANGMNLDGLHPGLPGQDKKKKKRKSDSGSGKGGGKGSGKGGNQYHETRSKPRRTRGSNRKNP